MIVVRIELHSAITRKVREIGVMRIANVGGNASSGDYEVRVQRRKERDLPAAEPDFDGWSAPVTRHTQVNNYPRLSYNVWRLVYRALKAAFPEEA